MLQLLKPVYLAPVLHGERGPRSRKLGPLERAALAHGDSRKARAGTKTPRSEESVNETVRNRRRNRRDIGSCCLCLPSPSVLQPRWTR